jgi:hypothetical protein
MHPADMPVTTTLTISHREITATPGERAMSIEVLSSLVLVALFVIATVWGIQMGALASTRPSPTRRPRCSRTRR